MIAQEVNAKTRTITGFVKTYVHRKNLCKPKEIGGIMKELKF